MPLKCKICRFCKRCGTCFKMTVVYNGKVQWERQFLDRLLIKMLKKNVMNGIIQNVMRDGNMISHYYRYYLSAGKDYELNFAVSPSLCLYVLLFIWISYMCLIWTDCGNGYEIVKLTDAQFDASSSYAEGPNDAEKTQSRIDHMPSMGQINNTNGRGSSLSVFNFVD